MAPFPRPHSPIGRRRWRLPVGLAALVLPLAACRPGGPGRAPNATPAPLQVVTSVLPITLFTRAVAGDCAR
ncbi:MAG: hypothetical protein VKI81_00215, partial [Synechococcaceae cyanobacterium]|nr:hypothetical protein [Synechococcaceae cyanobacterium]